MALTFNCTSACSFLTSLGKETGPREGVRGAVCVVGGKEKEFKVGKT